MNQLAKTYPALTKNINKNNNVAFKGTVQLSIYKDYIASGRLHNFLPMLD
jgi:hypothetical protein